jgi:hypothetical protein
MGMGKAMARAGTTGAILVLAVALTSLSPSRAASTRERLPDDYRVIVHPSNPVRALSREFLRDVYLKKRTSWWDGESIRPAGLSPRFAARRRFASEVLKKTPAQLRAYWNQQIFSGKGVPPPEFDFHDAVIAYVHRHRGAIAFVPASVDAPGVAVVSVK